MSKKQQFPRLWMSFDDPRFFRPFMVDFFKVMRNHRVSFSITMQQEEQWDLMGLTPMKNVIKGLLAAKLYHRPETLQAAEAMALVAKKYEEMGKTYPYTTKARGSTRGQGTGESDGTSETEGDTTSSGCNDLGSFGGNDGWQLTPQSNEFGGMTYNSTYPTLSGGSTHSNGHSDSSGFSTSSSRSKSHTSSTSEFESSTETETGHLHIVSGRDQVFQDAQAMLSTDMHRYDALLRWEEDGMPKAERIRVSPFGALAEFKNGRPVLAQFRGAVRRHTKRAIRPPYAAQTMLATAVAITPVDVPSRSEIGDTQPSDVAPAHAPAMTTGDRVAATPVRPLRETLVFPPRPSELASRDMRRIAVLDVIAAVRLCTIHHVMLLLRVSYDTARRDIDALEKEGLVDTMKRFAPRGSGSVPITYLLNGNGAKVLAEHGRPLEDLQRIAKNLGAHRRAIEENLPTQDRHRSFASTLFTLLVASARTIDPAASATEIAFDRERTFPVDLTPFERDISARDRLLISPNPTKTTVTYVPDFFFELTWRRDGVLRREPIFGEIETGFGERNAEELAIGKAWKMRALVHAFERTNAFGTATYAAGTIPRIVVWSRTTALEQGFFTGARGVFKDAKSPLWLTNGDVLPLTVRQGTKKKDLVDAVATLAANVQQPVWRWLRFIDPEDRRRFVGVKP